MMKVYKEVLGKTYKLLFFIITLEALFWSLLTLSTSLLEKDIINLVLYQNGQKQTIYLYISILIILVPAIWGMGSLRHRKIADIGKNIRDQIINTVLWINLGKINITTRDTMITGIAQDTGNFDRFLKNELFEGFKTVITIIVMASATAIFNWRFFVLSLACSVLFAFTLPLSKKVEEIEKNRQHFSEDSLKRITNIKENVFIFHIFPGTARYFAHFLDSIKKVAVMESAAGKVYSLLMTLAWGSNIIREAGILVIGFLVLKLEIGTVIALFTITSFMNSAIVAFIQTWLNFQKSLVASKRIKAIYDLPQEDKSITDDQSNSMTSYSKDKQPLLALNQAGFLYPGSAKGVNALTMEIQFGSAIHIKGNIGSGKSTLIKLISGILPVTNGGIQLNGLKAGMQLLREVTSVVDQSAITFEGSVIENISLFSDEPDVQKIQRLISMVKLDDWVNRQKNGLHTVVGRDTEMSGGQRQRLAICRALYKDTPILILDEATSALDNENEHIVMQIINELKGKKTILLIDHRERLASICSHTIFFEDGNAWMPDLEEGM